jgi:Flp pilus assembly secretin CpaC
LPRRGGFFADGPVGPDLRVEAGRAGFGFARNVVPVSGTADAGRADPGRGAEDRAGFGTGRSEGASVRAGFDAWVPEGAVSFVAVPSLKAMSDDLAQLVEATGMFDVERQTSQTGRVDIFLREVVAPKSRR